MTISQIRRLECDRCGRVHEIKGNSSMPIGWCALDVKLFSINVIEDQHHICPECSIAFKSWIKMPRDGDPRRDI